VNVFEQIGGAAIQRLSDVGALSIQLWAGLRASPHALPLVGKRDRWRAALQEMSAIGVDALPMIAIVSACAGSILALQSGTELRRFGALQLVINILAIGFTRELGPLLTAIVVSSRSGSAFSAEIGTMVVTSEIDALKTRRSIRSKSSWRRSSLRR
jgi:phospholipid/cholesterol/gamma-HCH transport system permease protein